MSTNGEHTADGLTWRQRLGEALVGAVRAKPNNLRIGIWGTTAAGKTTYLSILYKALLRSERWGVRADPKARRFVLDSLGSLLNANTFPPSTDVQAEPNLFTYEIAAQGPERGQPITLTFVDAAGEFYENPYQPAPGHGGAGLDILSYLSSCHGIIFLVDPTRKEADGERYWSLLMDLMEEFRERARAAGLDLEHRLPQYMAFCVTQVDRDGLWERRENPAELVRGAIGDFMFEALQKNYARPDRLSFFAVSAIGRYQEGGESQWCENVTYPAARSALQATMGYRPVLDPAPAFPAQPRGDTWWGSAPQEAPSAAQPLAMPTVRRADCIQPFQVVEPLEWLIAGIRRNPPRVLS